MVMNRSVPRVVELSEEIYIETTIPRDHHAALRSGFAGYPNNPRWTVRKYQAWKQGRQWRRSLMDGSMQVQNKQLVAANSAENETEISLVSTPEIRTSWRSSFKKFSFSLN